MSAKEKVAEQINNHFASSYNNELLSKDEQIINEFKTAKETAQKMGISFEEYLNFKKWEKMNSKKASS